MDLQAEEPSEKAFANGWQICTGTENAVRGWGSDLCESDEFPVQQQKSDLSLLAGYTKQTVFMSDL